LPRRTRIEPRRRSEVGLAQRECFVDAKTGAPQHNDQPAQPPAVHAVAGDAHDRDDLLDGGRVGWVAQPFVARRMTGVKPRHRRRRPSTTGGIKNDGSGHGLCRGYGRQPNMSPQTAREQHHRGLLPGPPSESAKRHHGTPWPLMSRMERSSGRRTGSEV
jgi:hypothetical protein